MLYDMSSPSPSSKQMSLNAFFDHMDLMDGWLTINKTKTRHVVQRVLDQYRKTTTYIARLNQTMTSTTTHISPTPPAATNINHSFDDKVNKKIMLELFLNDINRAVDELKLVNNDFIPISVTCLPGAYPSIEYYKDLLRYKYMSNIAISDRDIRKKLAEKYPDHYIDYFNSQKLIDKNRFYRDQILALDAFAVAYKKSQLVVYDN